MALRGLQQAPDSKRGRVANKGEIPVAIQETIEAPLWLTEDRLHEFWRMVDLNRAAGVAIRRVDADIYADLADCMVRQREADGDQYLRIARQINDLRAQLNMGPRNRARAGVHDKQAPKAVNPMAALIRMPAAVGQ